MLQTVMNESYWRSRLQKARESEMHQAVYDVSRSIWDCIQLAHSDIMNKLLPRDKVIKLLDVGCNYGSLLECLPKQGVDYLGVDYHQCLIAEAIRQHPSHKFQRVDDYKLLPSGRYDVAVCRSLDGSVKKQLGFAEWRRIEGAILSVADSLVLLSYSDPLIYRVSDSVSSPEQFTCNTIRKGNAYLTYRYGQDATCEIYDLMVPEEDRRKGLATEMVNKLFRIHPGTVYGFTRQSNPEAQAFYAAVGFTLQTVPNLYRGEDGVLFSQQRLPGEIE